MESSQAGFGDQCILQVGLSLRKRQQYGIQYHLNIDLHCYGGGFGCLCRALLALLGLWSAQGRWDELKPLQHLRLHGFLSLVSAGAALALVNQRGVSGQDVSMLYWKRWLPQGARLGVGGCAEISCTLALGFLKLAGSFVFPGGEMLPRAGTAATQHSVHQTALYINHVVDDEVETLAHLVNALLVAQRPSMGSRGAHYRASPARQEQCSRWQVWDVLGRDAGRENSISETRWKAGA